MMKQEVPAKFLLPITLRTIDFLGIHALIIHVTIMYRYY